MKIKTFLVCVFVFVLSCAVLFYFRVQDSSLVVNVGLVLNVYRESSERPGSGLIVASDTNVSLVKWPQSVSEKRNLNLKYGYNEIRITPVEFVISLHLNQMEKIVTISNLTITGSYQGSVSSRFAGIKPGTYNLTITVYASGFPEDQDRLHKFITVL